MRIEVNSLSKKVIDLIKSKEEVETFYKSQLEIYIEKVKEKSVRIEKLNAEVEKFNSDLDSKKMSLFNLWYMEFKEFKHNLLSVKELQSIINKYKISEGNLVSQKDNIIRQENTVLKNELAKKDDDFKLFKLVND